LALLREGNREVDLRLFYKKLRESKLNNENVFNELKELVLPCLLEGLYLVLNFDDCSFKYEELFDPDIKEFYGKKMLSPFMWTPIKFAENCWQSHLNYYKDSNCKLNKNFKFVVFSKFIIDPDMQEHDMINEIEKRFEKNFSLLNINVIILSNFKL
jgi:hypothetical protein